MAAGPPYTSAGGGSTAPDTRSQKTLSQDHIYCAYILLSCIVVKTCMSTLVPLSFPLWKVVCDLLPVVCMCVCRGQYPLVSTFVSSTPAMQHPPLGQFIE